jgi:tetratricopeptide (TPR) repeat protein
MTFFYLCRMRNLFVLLLVWSSLYASAQSDVIINTVTLYIAEGRYNDAEKYLDSLLKESPNSIDAMMMKGNVLLNYSVMQTLPINTITPDDESIYSQDLVSLKTPIVIISRADAEKIDKLWKRCLQLDSSRLDIREGMCTLYGMADMKKELIDYLPAIAKAAKEKGNDFVYALIQYAQLLADRGDKEGSYEVYKKIASLYPSMPVVWCQLSTAYSATGDLVNAKIYADKSFATAPSELSACGDALDLYSVLGDYSKALSVMKNAAAHDSTFLAYPFYDGIYRYAHHDSTWRSKLIQYVKQFPVSPDSDILYTASRYMLASDFRDDYSDFARLLTFSNSDFYTGLLTERAMHDFKDSVLPSLAYAELMVLGHNYQKANTVYASLDKKKMQRDAALEYMLQYAFSLYCSKEYTKALPKWLELNKNPDPVLSPMSSYFIGQCYLKSGNKPKALGYFQTLIDTDTGTKYGYLAKLQMQKSMKK